jgi:hypothetical protein
MGGNSDVGVVGRCTKMVTQEWWDKTKGKIDWMWRAYQDERGGDIDKDYPMDRIPHKKLESIWGFLVYVARTYSSIVPYLKGIHLTLDLWRDKRGIDGWPVDDDGWRISNTINDKLEDAYARQGGEEPPKFIRKAGRLGDDLKMLRMLTRDKEAPKRSVHSTETAAAYMFDNALGGWRRVGRWFWNQLVVTEFESPGFDLWNIVIGSVEAIVKFPRVWQFCEESGATCL